MLYEFTTFYSWFHKVSYWVHYVTPSIKITRSYARRLKTVTTPLKWKSPNQNILPSRSHRVYLTEFHEIKSKKITTAVTGSNRCSAASFSDSCYFHLAGWELWIEYIKIFRSLLLIVADFQNTIIIGSGYVRWPIGLSVWSMAWSWGKVR